MPGFLGYVTGLARRRPGEARPSSRLVLGALLFVLGFSVVFIADRPRSSPRSGAALVEHRTLLMRVGGRRRHPHGAWSSSASAASASRGCTSWRPAAAWPARRCSARSSGSAGRPCTGPTLAAVLCWRHSPADRRRSPAASSSRWHTALGLGLPFLLIAAGFYAGRPRLGWLRRHQRAIQVVGGVLLLAVGLLLVTGLWEDLNPCAADRLVNGFQTVI